jgi:flagellar hook-length control protein FliK
MMQNSPLFVAQPSPAKNATQSPKAKQSNDTSEQGESFKDVLSKQVEHKETKEKSNKSAVKTDAKTNIKKETDEQQQATLKAESEAFVVDETVDPQLLASTAMAKAVEDATDGEVVLDVPQEEDVVPVAFANITPIKETNPTDKVASDKAVVVETDVLAKQTIERTKQSLAEDEPVIDDDVTAEKGAQIESMDENESLSNKLANVLAGEKKAQASDEKLVSQTVSNVNNVSSLSAMNMQAAAKAFSQPVTAAEQVGSSHVINVAPGKTGWSEAIGQKVVWMVGAAEQSATLTLNPKDLGPLQVIINVNNEKADATFISENPEVRKALEEGMTNLRQSMGQAGVELGQANVNTNKEHQDFQQANKALAERQSGGNDSTQDAENLPSMPVNTRVSNGLVDTFA